MTGVANSQILQFKKVSRNNSHSHSKPTQTGPRSWPVFTFWQYTFHGQPLPETPLEPEQRSRPLTTKC